MTRAFSFSGWIDLLHWGMLERGDYRDVDEHVRELDEEDSPADSSRAMPKSILISKGTTTIPAEVRAVLHAEADTQLQRHVMPDGDVIVRAKTLSILDLAGSVKTAAHVEIEDMNPWGSRLRR
jgi:antitoxin PrlF